MKYNPDIHQRKSLRLKNYDYASVGYYFITICCKDRLPLFGEIKNNEMCLNEYGVIAKKEWYNTIHKRENIELDDFVVMPNHIHGIIKIIDHLESFDKEQINRFVSPKNNLSAIIRGYKSAVSSKIEFAVWQRNFYEHIIRDEKSYYATAEYIKNNPLLWEQDRFFI